MKRSSIVTLFFIFVACTTSSKNNLQIGIKQLEPIQLGDSTEKILNTLGKPSDKREDPAQTQDELWIYDDKNESQVGAVSIDKKLQTVTSVTALPREDEAESNLDYLLKTKFSSASFEKLPLRRCNRHFIPPETFHIDAVRGIIVISHADTKEVESFSRVRPSYASDLIKRIKDCRR